MSSRMSSVEDRYLNDPTFHSLVRAIEDLLERCEMTPTEVREAAVYACTRVAHRHPNTFHLIDPEHRRKLKEIHERFKNHPDYRKIVAVPDELAYADPINSPLNQPPRSSK